MTNSDLVKQGIMNAFNKAKIKYLREIKEACPVDTGFMRSNIVIEEMENGFRIHSKADYSSFVEIGTGKIKVGTKENPKQSWKAKEKRGDSGPSTMPFIVPTIYRNRKWLAKTIGNEIKKVFA